MPRLKITPAQMAAQWANAGHKFAINVHNFEVKAGRAAVEVFQGSFDKQKLNSSDGKRWAKWQGKYIGGGSLLREFGTLRNSIKVQGTRRHNITIWTDPAEFQKSRRHRGFCYAAVHNNLTSLTNKPLRGPKRERQFIGHSTVLNRELKELSVHIFDGLPK